MGVGLGWWATFRVCDYIQPLGRDFFSLVSYSPCIIIIMNIYLFHQFGQL